MVMALNRVIDTTSIIVVMSGEPVTMRHTSRTPMLTPHCMAMKTIRYIRAFFIFFLLFYFWEFWEGWEFWEAARASRVWPMSWRSCDASSAGVRNLRSSRSLLTKAMPMRRP